MPNPGTADYHRYLAAKKPIDDRSLNPRVWDSLARALPGTRPMDVLELGAGIGSMVQRVIERGLLTDCRYRAVDLEAWERGGGYASVAGLGTRAGSLR